MTGWETSDMEYWSTSTYGAVPENRTPDEEQLPPPSPAPGIFRPAESDVSTRHHEDMMTSHVSA